MIIASEESVHDDLTGALADAQASEAEDAGRFDAEAALTERLNWRRASLVAVAACLGLGLLETVNAFLMHKLDGHPRGWLYSLREQLPWWLLWMLFMPAIMWLARTYRFDGPRWRQSAVIHASAGLAIALAHASAYGTGFHYAASGAVFLATVGASVRFFLLRYLFMDIMTYVAAIGVYYSFEYFSGFRRSALAAARAHTREARLQLNLAEARIHALQMELNPHFLFNSLNAVSGLIRKRDHDAAVDMLARLGELLRTTLNRDMPLEIPLSDELELLRRFLDVELVRFGDRLRIVWEVEPETRDAFVPPLILQPLVENALRHGISRRPGAALLRISARRVGLHLELSVRDSGDGLASLAGGPKREGIGLANTKARLAQLYGREMTSLDLSDVAGGGARTRLQLPFHTTSGFRDVAIGA
jgi:two-component system, LytTR family, sensor kinase